MKKKTKTTKTRIKSGHPRLFVFLALIGLMFSGVLWRLYDVAVMKHGQYIQTARSQSDSVSKNITRGNVYLSDRQSGENHILANNQKFPVLTVNPAKINAGNPAVTAGKLAALTGIEEERIMKVLITGSDFSRPIDVHLTAAAAEKVKNSGIPGTGITYVADRFYPLQEVAAEIIGFLGYSGNERTGQYGIESYYEGDLVGSTAAAAGNLSAGIISSILSGFRDKEVAEEVAADRPKEIYLTVDKNIQIFAQKVLEDAVGKWSATGGSLIVQEPKTGKILAMADLPTFNPNTYFDNPPENFLNRNVQEIFEPGSSIKPLTMAMGLDLNKVTPETTYNDVGIIEINGYPIGNYDRKANGVQNMTRVLEKSLNTGAMHVEGLIGDDNFLNYLINMGFGQKTGVDLPGEVSGDITNLYSGRKINFLTASFGQGIAVTPLQLINAYSAIANGGKLMRPYIVDKIVETGGETKETQPEVAGIPFSEKTSARLRTMLISVVDNGFDKARIKGYEVAGKTGTAQIPGKEGGYEEGQFIHDFLGFAPANDPKFVILIKLDRPQGITYAADSLSPVFREMAVFLIDYLKIPPTR